jgi:predicted small metal-binding protein
MQGWITYLYCQLPFRTSHEARVLDKSEASSGASDQFPVNFIDKNEDSMIDEMIEEKMSLVQDLARIDSGYQADQNGGRLPAMASFTCRDMGIDCQFEVQATSDQALMRKFIAHAESDHNMQVLSADVIFRMRNAIKR